MKVWPFFQPNIQKMTILFLMLLLWIMPTWKVATCKICYKQHHGFPITFVILDSSSGLYTYDWIDYFSISAFLIDAITLYLLSCVIVFISYHLSTKKN